MIFVRSVFDLLLVDDFDAIDQLKQLFRHTVSCNKLQSIVYKSCF